MNPAAMTAMLIGLVGMFAWSAVRRFKLMTLGPAEARFSVADGELENRVKDTLIYALGQKKMVYYPIAGIAHNGIFIAFQVLLLNSIMLWFRGYDPTFGARPLKRVIQRDVLDRLARLVLGGELRDGESVTIDADGNDLVFRTERAETPVGV